jgi:hypothetical protein
LFETIAFLSTIGFFAIFVALIQAERAARRADDTPEE